MDKKTSALSVTAGLLVTLMSMVVCGVSVYVLIVSSDVRLAIGESVSGVTPWKLFCRRVIPTVNKRQTSNVDTRY